MLIGGPVWSGQVAAPVAAFLAAADLSAAAVAPFWTDTGSPRGYEADFQALADGAGDLLHGLGLSGDESITEPAGQQWIQQVTQAPTPTAASGGTSSARTVTVESGETSAMLTLNDSAAADEFFQRLPLTVQAREMFDYEYYGPLPEPLTADEPLETATEAGQVGFWTPGDQFVIYYDTPTRQPDGLLLLGTITDGLDRLADLGPTAELRISR